MLLAAAVAAVNLDILVFPLPLCDFKLCTQATDERSHQ